MTSLAAILSAWCVLSAQPLRSTAASNFRLYPSAVTQTEVFVVKHPADERMLFASANTINLSSGFISEGIYLSADGGLTWKGTDSCRTGVTTPFHRGDPGIAIDANGRYILTRLGHQDGLFSHTSFDSGKTWSSQRTIAGERQDRASLVTQLSATSPFRGRSTTAYVELLPPFPVKVASTTDGGSSWSSPLMVNNPLQRSQGAELAVGSDSMLYAVWAGVQSTSPYTEDFIGFARSSDGGNSWTVTENAIDINGIQGVLPTKSSIRVNGLPKVDVDRTQGPRKGWIYIVTTQRNLLPAGTDPDIVLYRSSDGGMNWLPGKRIHSDPLNNGKIQYFPAIHVDDGGGVNVLYYDDRTTTSDSVGVFVSRSTDGGETWNDFPVSDHHFRPQSIGGLGQGYQGDNIALTSSGGALMALWMDNRSGLYQIWGSRLPFTSLVSVKKESYHPQSFTVLQNYPNPFNPSTTIEFSIPSLTNVRAEVFDLIGRKVGTIMDQELVGGKHRIVFNAREGMASGVYIYRITAGNVSITRSMLLQR